MEREIARLLLASGTDTNLQDTVFFSFYFDGQLFFLSISPKVELMGYLFLVQKDIRHPEHPLGATTYNSDLHKTEQKYWDSIQNKPRRLQ